MPFIFFDLKNQLETHWKPIESLLKCMQIIYSPEINENDIKSLEKYIQEHLNVVKNIFKRNLSPKHHFFIHYPECIRRMGPTIHLWTMRLENKHKVLTEIARRKMNFKNLTKTLALEHQNRFCLHKPTLSTKIKPSATSGQFMKSMQFAKFKIIIKRDIGMNFDAIRVHKFASYDNIEYREGSLIIQNNQIYEIFNILSVDSNIYFLCGLHNILFYDSFCNSLIIEKNNDSVFAFNYDTLKNRLVYDKMYAQEKHFIIADTLVVAKLIN